MSHTPGPYSPGPTQPIVVQQKSGCLAALGIVMLVLIGLAVAAVIGFIVLLQLT